MMTQICDTDFDPETWWKEHPGEREEETTLFVVLAVIGRFFMPNNYRDRWELYPFCFGESSVGKGSLVNTLREIIGCPALVGELSSLAQGPSAWCILRAGSSCSAWRRRRCTSTFPLVTSRPWPARRV